MIDPRRRACGDAGQVGGIEVLPLGVLVMVVGMLLLANAWAVVDAHIATSAGAHAAARAVAESPDAATASIAARASAMDAVAGIGRDPDRIEVDISLDRPHGRCAVATVTVRSWVPAISLPWIGGFGQRFEIRSTAAEVVDPLREGLAGAATCIG